MTPPGLKKKVFPVVSFETLPGRFSFNEWVRKKKPDGKFIFVAKFYKQQHFVINKFCNNVR